MRHISSFKQRNGALNRSPRRAYAQPIISDCGAILMRANGDVLDLLILYGNPRAAPWQFRGALSPPNLWSNTGALVRLSATPLIAINFPRPNH